MLFKNLREIVHISYAHRLGDILEVYIFVKELFGTFNATFDQVFLRRNACFLFENAVKIAALQFHKF